MRTDGKPKAGVLRMMLPADADWTGREKKFDVDDDENGKRKK